MEPGRRRDCNQYTPQQLHTMQMEKPLKQKRRVYQSGKNQMHKITEHTNTENDCPTLSSYFSVVQLMRIPLKATVKTLF